MDLFTEKANSIIKRLNENNIVYSHYEDEDDKTQPDSNTQEEDDQAPTTSTPNSTDEEKMGLTPQALAAINVAKKMATQAQGGLFSNPQKKMNKAYGSLMDKIAGRIINLSKNV